MVIAKWSPKNGAFCNRLYFLAIGPDLRILEGLIPAPEAYGTAEHFAIIDGLGLLGCQTVVEKHGLASDPLFLLVRLDVPHSANLGSEMGNVALRMLPDDWHAFEPQSSFQTVGITKLFELLQGPILNSFSHEDTRDDGYLVVFENDLSTELDFVYVEGRI